jgi:hypothetical protein
VFVRRRDLEALTARAEAGDEVAADGRCELLAELGEVDALAARRKAGDRYAAKWEAELDRRQQRQREEAERARDTGYRDYGSGGLDSIL